jgi:hypothetical protein
MSGDLSPSSLVLSAYPIIQNGAGLTTGITHGV